MRARSGFAGLLSSHAGAQITVFDYLEGWYNRRHRLSALDYLSPIAYEKRELGPA